MNVKRYDLVQGNPCGYECTAKMMRANDGDYVKHEDYQHQREQIDKLREKIETVIKGLNEGHITAQPYFCLDLNTPFEFERLQDILTRGLAILENERTETE